MCLTLCICLSALLDLDAAVLWFVLFTSLWSTEFMSLWSVHDPSAKGSAPRILSPELRHGNKLFALFYSLLFTKFIHPVYEQHPRQVTSAANHTPSLGRAWHSWTSHKLKIDCPKCLEDLYELKKETGGNWDQWVKCQKTEEWDILVTMINHSIKVLL